MPDDGKIAFNWTHSIEPIEIQECNTNKIIEEVIKCDTVWKFLNKYCIKTLLQNFAANVATNITRVKNISQCDIPNYPVLFGFAFDYCCINIHK